MVGLLKTVRLPQGGSYEFGYERVGNTVDMPQSRYVLSSLVKDDGAAALAADRGEHRYAQSFSYSDGYYDRAERMFYGFATVTTSAPDGSTATTSYFNRDYYTKGIESGGTRSGPGGGSSSFVYQRQSSTVVPVSITGSLDGRAVKFPELRQQRITRFEPGCPEGGRSTSVQYAYDEFGNVTTYSDLGLDRSGDELRAEIRYDSSLPGYLKQFPTRIEVYDGSGKLLRRRVGSYGSSGELVQLDQYTSPTVYRRYSLRYDEYGNLASITDPRGSYSAWFYDNEVHSLPVLIERGNEKISSPRYRSSIVWDYLLGLKTAETDENGQVMRYSYDSFGRLIEVRSPYDTGSVVAVSYSYDLSSFPWSATSANKLTHEPSDERTMRTVTVIDGLGRVLQTAKQGEYRGDDGTRHYGWNLSGAIAYDQKARTVAQGQPRFEERSEHDLTPPGLAALYKPTLTSYDALDRAVASILPDGARTSTVFLIDEAYETQRMIDPLGNVTEKKLDERGNIASLARISSTGEVLMRASYEYNELGEILAVVDSKGNRITSSYDLVGARTLLSSPDTGTVLFSYDEAGNLVEKTDEVLRSRGETIRYTYDGLERLVRTTYPRTAPTVYVYGDENAPQGLVGRLVRREDASGSVSYEYGLLGETTAMTRIIKRLTPLADDESARFEYRSDYLGRMQSITYPDGEVVNYDYDSGGQVKSVTSEHNGLTTTYVADIAYDEFGQRTYIEYGNGTRTSYRYDENRRWLSGLRTTTQFGTVYQDMQYRFDLVGNVLGYTNDAGSYRTAQNYQYDSLYQLVYAAGESVYHPYSLIEYTSTYTQSFSYDELGNMTSKVSSSATRPSRVLGDNLNYNYTYSYYATKAHQAERIGTRYYRYDANGNVIEEREGGHGSGTVLGGTVSAQGELRMTDRGFGLDRTDTGGSDSEVYCRTYVWNEENKLIRSVDNQIAVDYRYDGTGERTVKYSVQGESLYFDPQWVCQTDGQNLRQLKNIYVGETRIATRLSIKGDGSTKYEQVNTYYYHADHLGSAQLISDYEGKEYERIEYTPYGESWIEKASDGLAKLPYRFTGKERDSETGLYYYGARYLNPTTGLWLSTDPALAEYLPVAPVDDEAKKHNQNLPGMGGAYNLVNLALYHYAGNNPVKYTDPDGLIIMKTYSLDLMTNYGSSQKLGNSTSELLRLGGCYVTGLANAMGSRDMYSHRGGFEPGLNFKRTLLVNNDSTLFQDASGDMKDRNMVMNKLFGDGKWNYWTKNNTDLKEKLKEINNSEEKYLVVGIFDLSSATTGVNNHMVGINGLPDNDGIFSSASITPTSQGDIDRLSDSEKKKAYSISNLKEIRIISLETNK